VLSTSELFPAGTPGIAARVIALRSGIQVRIAESGCNGDPAVVMLHGWGASLFTFHDAFARLTATGARVIAFDLRGHGLSGHPNARGSYSLEANLDDLDACLDALSLERAALVGHSLGGGIALHYALRRPDRVARLALINPVGVVPVRATWAMRLVPRWLLHRMGGRAIPRGLVELIMRYLAFGDASQITSRDVDEYWVPTQVPGFVMAIRAGIDEFDWAPLSSSTADSLSVPTLVIVGDRDRVIPHSDRGARRLHNARVVIVPGGHCVHEERPADVYRLLSDFFRERAP
jgi:pimeloyl-ACP methyl ester carboxylesterase